MLYFHHQILEKSLLASQVITIMETTYPYNLLNFFLAFDFYGS